MSRNQVNLCIVLLEHWMNSSCCWFCSLLQDVKSWFPNLTVGNVALDGLSASLWVKTLAARCINIEIWDCCKRCLFVQLASALLSLSLKDRVWGVIADCWHCASFGKGKKIACWGSVNMCLLGIKSVVGGMRRNRGDFSNIFYGYISLCLTK